MAVKKDKKKKVSNYFDIFSKIVSGLIEQRLKIKQRVEDVKNNVMDALYNLKVQLFRSVIEAFLLLTGVAALVVGSIMFLSKYLSLDILLLSYGIIICLAILFFAKLKRK